MATMTLRDWDRWALILQGVGWVVHGLIQYPTVWNSWDYYNLSPPTKLGKSSRKTVRAWMGLKVSRDAALGVILVILAASGASNRELGIICSAIAWCIFVDTVTMAANSNGGFYDRMRVGIHSSMATSLVISSAQRLYAPRPQACLDLPANITCQVTVVSQN